jgi:hypothetical protein
MSIKETLVAAKPVPKVSASVIAGAIVTILIGVAGQFDVEISAEVAAALIVVVVALAGWFAPRSDV